MPPRRDVPAKHWISAWFRRFGLGPLACVPILTAAGTSAVPPATPFAPSSATLQAAAACPTGQTLCAGVCTNASYDPQNCGRCGAICPAGIACAGGVCSCPPGLTNCAGRCTNTQYDPQNCNGCGSSCTLAHASTAACVQGTCAVVTCSPGFSNCDGVPANGCEANLASDSKNCGTCGTVCTAGCVKGHCQV
jgi:hypothetical protein